MTKPSNTARKAQATPDLRERAERLRDAAGRFIRRDQPQLESLPDEMPGGGIADDFRVKGEAPHKSRRGKPPEQCRDPAAKGDGPRQETDMGRHETFENAAPIRSNSFTPIAAGGWSPLTDRFGFDDAVASSLTITASPVLVRMIAEFQAASAYVNGHNGLSDAEAEPFHERALELQMDIYRFPAASVADLLAKVPVFQDELDDAVRGLSHEHRPEDTLAGAAWLGLFRDFRRLVEPAVAVGTTIGQCRSEPSDLALACIHQVERLDWLDDAIKPDMDDDALDAELDRWGEVSTRAINEPSTNAFDLAAKARLAFADLDRFHPLERCNTNDWLLFRAIMHDAIALGGAGPIHHQTALYGEAQALVDAIERAWSDCSVAERLDGTDMSPDADTRFTARSKRRDDLIDAALALSANSRAARHAKALALAWLEFAQLWQADAERSDYAADGLLAIDINAALVSGASA